MRKYLVQFDAKEVCMDYKRLIKSRKVRLFILKLLNFVPDKLMLKLQYRIKFGRKLDLRSPKRFTEKLQWYKLYYKNPLLVQCVDKYDVRKYVEEKGLTNILNECYGVYENVNDINFDILPHSFVIKDTLGGGGNSVIIVTDKNTLDRNETVDRLKEWLKPASAMKGGGREWPYYSGEENRIVIEKYIQPEEGSLDDYKFFCFDGRVECLYVMKDRKLGESVKVGIFNRNFEKLKVLRAGDEDIGNNIEKPKYFERMVEIAEQLSADFPHVRVDLYNVDGNIVFGELTFYGASGYMKFDPDTFDYELGEKFNLKVHKEV